MNKKTTIVGTAGLLAASALFANAADATAILCKTTANDHMLVDDSYVSACVDAGMGNINGNPSTDDFLTGANSTGFAGIGSGSFTQTGNTGTFSFDSSLWGTHSSVGIGFKFGTGNEPDEWFVYTLQNGVSYGTWEFVNEFNKGGGLSHVQLYSIGGGTTTTTVPEPSTLALLGLGLLSAPLVRRLRKR